MARLSMVVSFADCRVTEQFSELLFIFCQLAAQSGLIRVRYSPLSETLPICVDISVVDEASPPQRPSPALPLCLLPTLAIPGERCPETGNVLAPEEGRPI